MPSNHQAAAANQSVWEAFRSRHPAHRFLDEDPLYALTEEVISALVKGVPGLLTAEDEEFERDLYRTAGGGFFHGRPLGGLLGSDGTRPAGARVGSGQAATAPADRLAALLAKVPEGLTIDHVLDAVLLLDRFPSGSEPALAPPLRPDWDPDAAVGDAIELIRGAIAGVGVAAVEPRPDVEVRDAEAADEQAAVRHKQEAYAMWLVLQPGYRADVEQLRRKWEGRVRRPGSSRHPRGRRSDPGRTTCSG